MSEPTLNSIAAGAANAGQVEHGVPVASVVPDALIIPVAPVTPATHAASVRTEAAQVAGWYGKIPALGDFASRRLPQDFIDAWDGWLQHVLGASRERLGPQWQEAYLGSPVWRFLLLPGACGERCWAGVMMPSVDRVGRQFPLTIAVMPDAAPDAFGMACATRDWFDAIEDIALACLSLDFPVEALEERLMATPLAGPSPEAEAAQAAARDLAAWWRETGTAPARWHLPDQDALARAMTDSAMRHMTATGAGKSLWWTHDEMAGASELHGFRGLPSADDFVVLLTGAAAL